MEKDFPLSRLRPGERAVVQSLENRGLIRRRLRDIGLVAADSVSVPRKRPENAAAAEIAYRLHLPQAAATRNSRIPITASNKPDLSLPMPNQSPAKRV